MKRTLIIALALTMTLGISAQKKKTGKKADPTVAIFEKQNAEFQAANAELAAKMKAVNDAYYAAKTPAEQDSISKIGMSLYPKMQEAQQAYMKANPSTVLTASFISSECSAMPLDELKAAYDKLDANAKASEFGKEISTEITARENTMPGKPAPMIAKNDIDGKPFSLADLKGNVVIIDFWATWCVPCRASNPHMMRIYNKYHDRGLKMVYVADDDGNVDKLRQAIEKDGVGRPDIYHVLRGLKTLKDKKGDFAGFDRSQDLDDAYGVHEIPTKFLIDRNGNIVGKVESEKWLDEQLSQIYDGKPNRDFHIDGHIDGIDGDSIYLSYDALNTAAQRVACKVENGKFHFDGTLAAKTSQAYLIYMKDVNDPRSQKYAEFFLEPSEIKVNADINDFRNIKEEGSDAQDELMAFNETIKEPMDKITELNAKYEKATNGDERQALHDEMGPYSEQISRAKAEYAKAHPDSPLAPDFLFWTMSRMQYAELKATFDKMPAELKATPRGQMIAKEIESQARVQPGEMAYVIKKEDVMTGKMVDMEKMRGKYVIVDFWASWCVPCRKSNPHMIELYNRYHKKGLEFIYVGDNDSRPQDLKDAIVKDGVKKMHHVLRGLKIIDRKTYQTDRTNDIADHYGIHSLPTKYLIDREGKIVGKFSSEELDKKLKEIFGE